MSIQPGAKDYARKINGLRQRLEAAMLLLGICPQCGWKTFHIYGDDGQWQVTCPEHGLVNTRTYDQLLGQLDIGFGVDAGLDDS